MSVPAVQPPSAAGDEPPRGAGVPPAKTSPPIPVTQPGPRGRRSGWLHSGHSGPVAPGHRLALSVLSLVALLFATRPGRAAVPPVEQLLPADTLFVLAIPDCARLRAIFAQTPYGRLWNDPAMKPFRDKFVLKWKQELLAPLERDLGVRFSDYPELAQGELAFAVTQDGWQGRTDAAPGFLLLLDTRAQSDQLKKLLAALRQQWVDSGKTVQTEKIRDVEFSVVELSSNNVPKSLKRFFPQRQEIQELGKAPDKKSPDGERLIIGQAGSLLIAGTSDQAVTKVMLRLAGGAVPALAEDATFAANRLALFADAPAFAWFNAKSFFSVLAHLPPEKPNPLAPNPLPLPPMDKIVTGCGLTGLNSAAFALRHANDGLLLDAWFGAPEAGRQGLLKLLAAEPKDSNPPAFVPADAVKFWRWRLDGPKAVAAFETLIGEVRPEWLNSWNFLISSGEEAVKLEEPAYNLRRDLIGNLGDDLIAYEKAPRGKTLADLESPPSLVLIGSPHADTLVRALRGALIIRSGDALAPKVRDFLGRKIYSITIPPSAGARPPAPRTLHYAASGGYVAFSTDVSMVEEYLRSGEAPKRALREIPGLAEAAQQVGGQNTGWFGYENRAETMRATFELLKNFAPAATNAPTGVSPLVSSLPYAGPEKNFTDWMDFTLLPDYDKVAKYFHYLVYSGSANADGLRFRCFWPTPPGLKQ
jgi:hypothetical protein